MCSQFRSHCWPLVLSRVKADSRRFFKRNCFKTFKLCCFIIRVCSQVVILYPLYMTCVLIAEFPCYLPFFVLPTLSSDIYTFVWTTVTFLSLTLRSVCTVAPSKLMFLCSLALGTQVFPIPLSTHCSLWGFHSTPTLRSLLPQVLIASQCCTAWCSSSVCFSRSVSVTCLAGRNRPTTKGKAALCLRADSLAVTSWFIVLQPFWALVFVSILQWPCGFPCRKL